MYMDKEGIFYQYDITNREKCRPINISSRIPLNKSEIIDVVFNEKTSSFYTLNRNWVLEVWELHQNISVPVSSMKVITEISDDKQLLEDSYPSKRTFKGVFPQFLSLSRPNG